MQEEMTRCETSAEVWMLWPPSIKISGSTIGTSPCACHHTRVVEEALTRCKSPAPCCKAACMRAGGSFLAASLGQVGVYSYQNIND